VLRIRRLKEEEECNVPIIFITAHGDARMRIRAMRGCSRVSCKTVRSSPLIEGETGTGKELVIEPILVLFAHMQLRQLTPSFLQRSLLALCIALNSCQSHKANSRPSIEFTHFPPAAQGGRERVGTISGRVRNARSNQQIVIYAHNGQW
jgi:hypothetical protein